MNQPKDADRFARLCRRSVTMETAQAVSDTTGIGTYAEKRLHALLKRFITDDETLQEVRVPDRNGKPGKFVADVKIGNDIYEVQTGSFYPMKKSGKIAWYLENTDNTVTIVHPLAVSRYLSWIEPDNGEISSRRRSPRKERPEDALKECFWLAPLLGNPRLRILLWLLDMEEYRLRNGYSADGKRGSQRYDRIPSALREEIVLSTPNDYRRFLSADLPSPFTAAQLGKSLHLRGRAVYSALHLFLSLGLLAETEKNGRAKSYVICPASAKTI